METAKSTDPNHGPHHRRIPANKVVGISAGEAHTLILTGSGEVYSWGRGTFGRLGAGNENDHGLPVLVRFDEDIKLVGVAAGAYHSLALGDDGSIWSWGYNAYGQLGFDGENVSVPRRLDRFTELDSSQSIGDDTKETTPLKASTIKAGGMMSLAIDNLGKLWIWGNCPQPTTSTDSDHSFSLTTILTPVPVPYFHGHMVVKVACGNEHVVALVASGETYEGNNLVCYSWGGNRHGQLGLGDTQSISHPQPITTLNQGSIWSPYELACGAFHTVVLAKKNPNESSESVCWTFGQGENGQLGHGTTQNAVVPQPVEALPENTYFVSVGCGLFHTSIVSSSGQVWSWGMEKGLGLCPDASFTGTDPGDALLPLSVPCNDHQHGPRFPDPVQITCGAAHTVLVANGGYRLWSWGRGASGVLGDGRSTDSYTPTSVSWGPHEHEPLSTSKDEDGKGEVVEIEEMKVLKAKLSLMERYASVLHGCIFGKVFEEGDIPLSLRESGSFDVGKEWENMLEIADLAKLKRLEMFYGNLIDGVRDMMLKKRVKEIVQECMNGRDR